MRYIYHFKSGKSQALETSDVSFARLDVIAEHIRGSLEHGKIIIFIDELECIVPEEQAVSNKSAVVTPPTPDDLKNEAKRKLDKIQASSKSLVSRIKQKAEDE